MAAQTIQELVRAPKSVNETGLQESVLVDLCLKIIHQNGYARGLDIADTIQLPFADVVEPIIGRIKEEKFVEVRGGQDFGSSTMEYSLTERGRSKVTEAMSRNTYIGPAPIPFERYKLAVQLQGIREVTVTQAQMKEAMGDLTISPTVVNLLGPAANSGHSMFLFGKPGNGKTSVAERLAKCLGGEIYTPHAVEFSGSIIKVFDEIVHTRIESTVDPTDVAARVRAGSTDGRWVKTKRPFVMVGGELTLANLDLIYHEYSKFYEAPFQMKANCGIFLIDDFGRQQCRPQDLLNRWIVPLESRVDFLTLQSGQKFELPFMVLVIFATNIKPSDLVDEAFLRRIHYKVFAESPTVAEFNRIFENCCLERSLPFERTAVEHLLQNYYAPRKIALRGCQPRDLLEHVVSLADYRGEPRRVTPELLDSACAAYFVDERETPVVYA